MSVLCEAKALTGVTVTSPILCKHQRSREKQLHPLSLYCTTLASLFTVEDQWSHASVQSEKYNVEYTVQHC